MVNNLSSDYTDDVMLKQEMAVYIDSIAMMLSQIEKFNDAVNVCIETGLFSHEALESYMIKDKEEKEE